MTIARETRLNLAKPSDGDRSHGAALRQNADTLGHVAGPANCFFVSPSFTAAALANGSASDRRHFDTIQAAIDAAQGPGYPHKATVFIYPGKYEENLVITNSVTLAAFSSLILDGLGGGRSVEITGQTGIQAPTIQIVPPGDTATAVNLIGLGLSNNCAVAGANIAKAHILDAVKPATYANRLFLGMKDCAVRAQTYGDGNIWEAGLKATGWVEFTVRDCDFQFLSYGGGNNNAGHLAAFFLRGDSPNGHGVTFGGKNINVWMDYGFTGLSPIMFNVGNQVVGSVGRSNFGSRDFFALYEVMDNGGYNNLAGLWGTGVEQYGNLQGINLSWF